jgi:hypothetical protein
MRPVPRPDVRAFRDADAILGSLSVMVARGSAAGTLREGFVAEMMTADPSGSRLCQLLGQATTARAQFGASFLCEAGRHLLGPDAAPAYDGGLAWMLATSGDPALALDVLGDRELAAWLVSSPHLTRAASRARSRLLAIASEGQGRDRRRSVELARWAREECLGAEASAPSAPYDGLAALLGAEMLTLDEMANDHDHPGRAGTQSALGRMQGDYLAASTLADACARFNRARIQGAAPADRPAAVAASCSLLDFVVRPVLADPREGYLQIAAELMAMTGLWTVLRDGGDARPAELIALWPGASEGEPVRLAELGRIQFRAILQAASQTSGLAGELVAATLAGGMR